MKRIECWQDTLRVTKFMQKPPSSEKVVYDDQMYTKKFEKSNVKFFDMDAIDCCLDHSPDALVLNLADDLEPGGLVAQGSGAQEESLFRRTNYHMTLTPYFYPLADDEAVYSPNVSVIKTKDWKDMAVCQKVSFIACAGLKYPKTVNGRLLPKDVSILKMKIKLIVQTARNYQHDTIIFGALGCGAWNNPRDHVAEIFKEVLLGECDGIVKNYYFAILTTPGDDGTVYIEKTIDVFRNIFLS